MDNIRHRLVTTATTALASAVVMLFAGCASSSSSTRKAVEPVGLQKEETSIPFAAMDQSIHDWQANGQEGLWIQDVHRDWYYARTLGPCIGLDWAVGIGIETRGSQLDRFGTILVPREHSRCTLTSFVRSDVPPPSRKKSGSTEATKEATGAPPATAPASN